MSDFRRPDPTAATVVEQLRNGLRTCAQIAEAAGVSDRTIYRRIAKLKKRGVPIIGAPGVGYMMRGER